MGKDTLTLKQLMFADKLSDGMLSDRMLLDLEDGFKKNFTIEETCRFAGIHKGTYDEWCKRSDEFATRMARATSLLAFVDKRNIAPRLSKCSDQGKYAKLTYEAGY